MRQRTSAYLSKQLRSLGGVDPLPDDERITRRGFYYYIYKYDAAEFKGLPRDAFLEALRAEGVTVAGRAYGTPIHKYPLFARMKGPGRRARSPYARLSMPVAEDVCANRLCTLPHALLLQDRATLAKGGRGDREDQGERG